MSITSIHNSFWLLTAILFTILIGWFTMADGMFFDGIFYATLANNMANGMGSFWHLTYTQTLHSECYEQPPFVFFLQSLLFRIAGDGTWIERVYCLLMAVGTAYVIRYVWVIALPKQRHFGWLPVIIWLCFPIVPWTYQNNLMEGTMGLFDLLAVHSILIGMLRSNVRWVLAGSAFIFLSSFCKGLQGMFPLAMPLAYLLFIERIALRKYMTAQAIVLVVPIIMYIIFFAWPDANHFYENYLHRRLQGTFDGLQDTTQSHFYLLIILLGQLVIPILILLLLYVAFKKPSFNPTWNWVKLFVFIGLCGSLPLLITLEQRPFYLATTMPYFALAIAAFSFDLLRIIIERFTWSERRIRQLHTALLGVLIVCLVILPFYHTVEKRDHALLHDLSVLEKTLSLAGTVQIPESMADDWATHAYFARYLGVSLDHRVQHSYFITLMNEASPSDPCYTMLPLALRYVTLYHCEEKQ